MGLFVTDHLIDSGAAALYLAQQGQANDIAVEGDGGIPIADDKPGVVKFHGCVGVPSARKA